MHALTARPSEAAPMIQMNTTPLIDVMLVLLIMMIITIPLQSHAVKMDLPSGLPPHVEVNPLKNKLVVTSKGGLLWNGASVTRPELRSLLEATAANPREPELHLQPAAEAPYAAVDEVLAMTKRADVRHVGFVGNEAYRSF